MTIKFRRLSGGSGEGGIPSLSNDVIFPSNVERDAYFAANPEKLKDGVLVSSGGVLQKWDSNTSSFVDITPVISGKDAPELVIQYSATGVDGWETTLNTSTHKYWRWSTNGGVTFSADSVPFTSSGGGASVDGIPVNHIPMVGEDGKLVDSAAFMDDRNLHLEGSLVLGTTASIYNAVGTIGYSLPDGSDALGVNSIYTEQGTGDPFYYKLGAREDFPICTERGTTIPSPYGFSYVKQGDNLLYDLKFVPKSAGTLRLRYYLGTEPLISKLIFDEVRAVTEAEVTAGLPVLFGKGNKFLVPAGERIYISLEGVALDGGVPTTGQRQGVLTPYLVPTVHAYRKKPFFDFGWFNYDNANRSQIVQPGVWTTLQNDTLGVNTYTNFPPDEVTRMIDPATGRILLDELDVGDEVYIRHTINLIPQANTTSYSFSQYFGEGAGAFRLPIGMPATLDEGAGVPTGDFLLDTHFYILDDNSRLNGMLPQVLVSNVTEVRYTGCYISVTRRA